MVLYFKHQLASPCMAQWSAQPHSTHCIASHHTYGRDLSVTVTQQWMEVQHSETMVVTKEVQWSNTQYHQAVHGRDSPMTWPATPPSGLWGINSHSPAYSATWWMMENPWLNGQYATPRLGLLAQLDRGRSWQMRLSSPVSRDWRLPRGKQAQVPAEACSNVVKTDMDGWGQDNEPVLFQVMRRFDKYYFMRWNTDKNTVLY